MICLSGASLLYVGHYRLRSNGQDVSPLLLTFLFRILLNSRFWFEVGNKLPLHACVASWLPGWGNTCCYCTFRGRQNTPFSRRGSKVCFLEYSNRAMCSPLPALPQLQRHRRPRSVSTRIHIANCVCNALGLRIGCPNPFWYSDCCSCVVKESWVALRISSLDDLVMLAHILLLAGWPCDVGVDSTGCRPFYF